MEIKDYEELLKTEVKELVNKIIQETPVLPIDVRQGERVGDGVSKFLETKFLEYANNTTVFTDTQFSPLGKTKNPWDVETTYNLGNHKEIIWIDFKAINVENDNSNPDSGTPNKVFELMLVENSFYLMYVVVYYKGLGPGNGLELVEHSGNKVKTLFLKDVEDHMHITPANQIQFNIFAPEKYRTRDEFLKFFFDKLVKCNERRIEDAQQKLQLLREGKYAVPKTISKTQTVFFQDLFLINEDQESSIQSI